MNEKITFKEFLMKTVTMTNGLEVKINGLSPFMPEQYAQEFGAMNPEPKPPVYTALTVGGGIEIHDYDLKALPEEREKPEDESEVEQWKEDVEVLKKWDAYVKAHDEWQGKSNEYMISMSLLDGVNAEPNETNEHFVAWKKKTEKRMNKFGLKLPEDEDELKLKYIKTGLIGSADDMAQLLAAVLGTTGVPQARIEAVRTAFQS